MEHDWGCLYVWGKGTSLQAVEAAVHAAYAAAGLKAGSISDADPLLPPLYLNASKTLTADDVFVVEDECGWIAVMSLNFEWAPPGGHPLGLALSQEFEVLAITSNAARRWVEYSIYRGGKLAEIAWEGNPPGAPDGPPLRLGRLAERGGFDAEELEAVLTEPQEFAKFVGCEWTGHRMVYETMTLSDLGEDRLHTFR